MASCTRTPRLRPRRQSAKINLLSRSLMSQHSGNVFMVIAPSGAGKASLVNAPLERAPSMVLYISCTTRTPRPGEVNDKHYRFVSVEEFNALRDAGAMLEWAEVHGNFYGTPRDRI